MLTSDRAIAYFMVADEPPRMRRVDVDPASNDAAARVMTGAIRVHRAFGPGLPARFYREALELECADAGLRVDREVRYAVRYRGGLLGKAFQPDLVVDARRRVRRHVAVARISARDAEPKFGRTSHAEPRDGPRGKHRTSTMTP